MGLLSLFKNLKKSTQEVKGQPPKYPNDLFLGGLLDQIEKGVLGFAV